MIKSDGKDRRSSFSLFTHLLPHIFLDFLSVSALVERRHKESIKIQEFSFRYILDQLDFGIRCKMIKITLSTALIVFFSVTYTECACSNDLNVKLEKPLYLQFNGGFFYMLVDH